MNCHIDWRADRSGGEVYDGADWSVVDGNYYRCCHGRGLDLEDTREIVGSTKCN